VNASHVGRGVVVIVVPGVVVTVVPGVVVTVVPGVVVTVVPGVVVNVTAGVVVTVVGMTMQQNAESQVPVAHTALSEILEYPVSQVKLAQVGAGLVVVGAGVGGGTYGVVVTVVGMTMQQNAESQVPVAHTALSEILEYPVSQVKLAQVGAGVVVTVAAGVVVGAGVVVTVVRMTVQHVAESHAPI